MPYVFRGFGFSDDELPWASLICRVGVDEIHDSCPNTHKYARKERLFPLDEGMDCYLCIGVDLVTVRERLGAKLHLDLHRAEGAP